MPSKAGKSPYDYFLSQLYDSKTIEKALNKIAQSLENGQEQVDKALGRISIDSDLEKRLVNELNKVIDGLQGELENRVAKHQVDLFRVLFNLDGEGTADEINKAFSIYEKKMKAIQNLVNDQSLKDILPKLDSASFDKILQAQEEMIEKQERINELMAEIESNPKSKKKGVLTRTKNELENLEKGFQGLIKDLSKELGSGFGDGLANGLKEVNKELEKFYKIKKKEEALELAIQKAKNSNAKETRVSSDNIEDIKEMVGYMQRYLDLGGDIKELEKQVGATQFRRFTGDSISESFKKYKDEILNFKKSVNDLVNDTAPGDASGNAGTGVGSEEVEKLKTKVDELKDSVEEIKSKFSTIDENTFKTLSENVDTLVASIGNLENKLGLIDDKDNVFDKMNSDIGELKNNLKDVSDLLEKLRNPSPDISTEPQAETQKVSSVKKQKGDTLTAKVFHGSKNKWTDKDFDFNKTKAAQMGSGMYFTPDATKVANFGKGEIKQLEVTLDKCFIINKDYVTSVEDLYKAMNKEVVENITPEKAMSDLREFARSSKENSDVLRRKMLDMGYQGLYVGDNLANKVMPEELVIYDEGKLKELKSFTNNEFQELKTSGSIEIKLHNPDEFEDAKNDSDKKPFTIEVLPEINDEQWIPIIRKRLQEITNNEEINNFTIPLSPTLIENFVTSTQTLIDALSTYPEIPLSPKLIENFRTDTQTLVNTLLASNGIDVELMPKLSSTLKLENVDFEDEKNQLKGLLDVLQAVKILIEKKNAAFIQEGNIVRNIIPEETNKIGKLVSALNNVLLKVEAISKAINSIDFSNFKIPENFTKEDKEELENKVKEIEDRKKGKKNNAPKIKGDSLEHILQQTEKDYNEIVEAARKANPALGETVKVIQQIRRAGENTFAQSFVVSDDKGASATVNKDGKYYLGRNVIRDEVSKQKDYEKELEKQEAHAKKVAEDQRKYEEKLIAEKKKTDKEYTTWLEKELGTREAIQQKRDKETWDEEQKQRREREKAYEREAKETLDYENKESKNFQKNKYDKFEEEQINAKKAAYSELGRVVADYAELREKVANDGARATKEEIQKVEELENKINTLSKRIKDTDLYDDKLDSNIINQLDKSDKNVESIKKKQQEDYEKELEKQEAHIKKVSEDQRKYEEKLIADKKKANQDYTSWWEKELSAREAIQQKRDKETWDEEQKQRRDKANKLSQDQIDAYKEIWNIKPKIASLDPNEDVEEINVLKEKLAIQKQIFEDCKEELKLYDGIIDKEKQINELRDIKTQGKLNIKSINARRVDESNKKSKEETRISAANNLLEKQRGIFENIWSIQEEISKLEMSNATGVEKWRNERKIKSLKDTKDNLQNEYDQNQKELSQYDDLIAKKKVSINLDKEQKKISKDASKRIKDNYANEQKQAYEELNSVVSEYAKLRLKNIKDEANGYTSDLEREKELLEEINKLRQSISDRNLFDGRKDKSVDNKLGKIDSNVEAEIEKVVRSEEKKVKNKEKKDQATKDSIENSENLKRVNKLYKEQVSTLTAIKVLQDKIDSGDLSQEDEANVNSLIIGLKNKLLENQQKYNEELSQTYEKTAKIQALLDEIGANQNLYNIDPNKDLDLSSFDLNHVINSEKITDDVNKIISSLQDTEVMMAKFSTAIGTNIFKDAFNDAEQEVRELNDQLTSGDIKLSEYNSKITEIKKNLNSKMNTVYELVNPGNIKEANEFMLKYMNTISNGKAEILGFNDKVGQLTFRFEDQNGMIQRVSLSLNKMGTSVERNFGKAKTSLSGFEEFLNSLKGKFADLARYLMTFVGFHEFISMIRNGIRYVVEFDSAMTELIKVSNDSEKALRAFGDESFRIADQVASTGTEVTQAAADWSRLGYSIKEASELAKNSAIYVNVGDGIDVETATSDMVSAMKAFNIEAEDSMRIVDRYNAVANEFAISSGGIGEAMSRSSAALAMAGNSIDQSIAMATAMNEILQDESTVGQTLKTLSLRLRGAKTELEEAGESTDGMAESTSKLREQVLALTNVNGKGGFDIMLNDKEFKSTYDIVKGIAEVWKDIDDIDQAALLELLSGKTRAQGMAALLTNFAQAENALQTSLESEGSALRENEKYMDSIQGKISQVKNSWQELWTTGVDEDLVKGVIDLAQGLLDAANNAGLLKTAMAGVGAVVGVVLGYKTKDSGGRARNFVVISKLITCRSLINIIMN